MKRQISFHKHALSCWAHNFPTAILLTVSSLIAWGIFFISAFSCIQHFGFIGIIVSFILALLLYVYRFYVSNHLFRLIVPDAPRLKPLTSLVFSALIRFLFDLLWFSPFALLGVQLYRYYNVLPFPRISKDLSAIGKLFSPESSIEHQTSIGMILYICALIISFFLFLYGMRRGRSFIIAQTQGLSFKKSLNRAIKIRKRSKKTTFFASLINGLLLFISILIPFTTLIVKPFLEISPFLTGKALADVQIIFSYIKNYFVSSNNLLFPICLFVLLYFPLLPFRKLHYTAAMVIRHE